MSNKKLLYYAVKVKKYFKGIIMALRGKVKENNTYEYKNSNN